MQHFTTSDSLEALVSIFPSKGAEEQSSEKSGRVYSREFQAMLDSLESEDGADETGFGSEKKRRLGIDQVRALERYFEVENKLDPDRKVKLAEELGLQPRQVAIWFQNRRARWKTKQLERDFRLLKANYDSLNQDFSSLRQEKEALSAELEELKEKLEMRKSKHSRSPANPGSAGYKLSPEQSKSKGSSDMEWNGQLETVSPPDCRGFKNVQQQQEVSNWFELSDPRLIPAAQQQAVKMEEMSVFSSEECCNIYCVDQPPTLHCYFQQ